jgi:hypothetical protein
VNRIAEGFRKVKKSKWINKVQIPYHRKGLTAGGVDYFQVAAKLMRVKVLWVGFAFIEAATAE